MNEKCEHCDGTGFINDGDDCKECHTTGNLSREYCECSSCEETHHLADCAVHNMPAIRKGPCSCGAIEPTYSNGYIQGYKDGGKDANEMRNDLVKTFSHVFVAGDERDTCHQCGLDLRNDVHARILAGQGGEL